MHPALYGSGPHTAQDVLYRHDVVQFVYVSHPHAVHALDRCVLALILNDPFRNDPAPAKSVMIVDEKIVFTITAVSGHSDLNVPLILPDLNG
jgi:hypothetical protein